MVLLRVCKVCVYTEQLKRRSLVVRYSYLSPVTPDRVSVLRLKSYEDKVLIGVDYRLAAQVYGGGVLQPIKSNDCVIDSDLLQIA